MGTLVHVNKWGVMEGADQNGLLCCLRDCCVMVILVKLLFTVNVSPPPSIAPLPPTGNGPSGICLSALLSGYRPYLAPGGQHPNPLLQHKLEENQHLSILDQDLEYLSEGLEGRSANPVALLFDTLLLPDGDSGRDFPSPLQWRFEAAQRIPHLVLGRGPPGGAWHVMEGSMLTLSFGSWMELPGLKLKDWVRDKRRNVRNDRATPAEMAAYYQHYVSAMRLHGNFVSNSTVTSMRRVCTEPRRLITGGWDRVGEHSQEEGAGVSLWEVCGHREAGDGGREPFRLQAENVVLATGTQDQPCHLGVEGEDLPFVRHSLAELETAIAGGVLGRHSEPVLVVGAGLTAADAVLGAHHANVPVVHAFRRGVTDPAMIFNQLPKVLYPEYHKVHQMMSQQHGSGSYPGYRSLPKHRVTGFRPDGKCLLESEDGRRRVLNVSLAVVLIGAGPRLSFLPERGLRLGQDPEQPVSCRQNPVDVEPFTYELTREPGLFAMGPLVGDNFVRFLRGGALGIASCLAKRRQRRDTRHKD
uniref:Oxidative stress-induced growth inhibitor 1 n=1 Tax=Callorhinchus milii TaxID=7868 RepID=A0A4W3K2H1_CALMI